MKYEILIARRYLRAKRQVALVSLISAIAVTGVTVGVAALICTLSVFNGFGSVVTSMLVGFDPHVRVTGVNGQRLHDADRMLKTIRETPDVAAAEPVVSGRLMVVHDEQMKVVTADGVTGNIAAVSGVAGSVVQGHFIVDRKDYSGPSYGMPGIVLGIGLADRLRAECGEIISLVSPVGIDAAYTQFAQPLSRKFVITGIYASKNKEYDSYFAYIDVKEAQQLFDLSDNEVDGVDIRCTSINRAEAVQLALQGSLAAAGNNVRVETWYDLHRDLYSVMEMERWVAYIILCLIIVVSAFTILGSLTMTVIEKQRDISLLKAVGATDAGVRRIFLYAGTSIGIVGTIAGTALGALVCWLQITFHILKLSAQFVIPALPVEMRVSDFVIVGASAIVLCTLAAVYPARRAAKVEPAEGLRWE